MSTDERKTERPAPAPRTPAGMEPIKVKELWFATERDVPLSFSEGGLRVIKAGRSRRSTMIEIQFEPWQRHHRVRELDDGKQLREFCVPESAVLYVPDAGG